MVKNYKNYPCFCCECRWSGLRDETEEHIQYCGGYNSFISTNTCPNCGNSNLMLGEENTPIGISMLETRINGYAVNKLSSAMKRKLLRTQQHGRKGWYDVNEAPKEKLDAEFHAAVRKGDPVDVANYCAMFLARGEKISSPPTPLTKDEEIKRSKYHNQILCEQYVLVFSDEEDHFVDTSNSGPYIWRCVTPLGSYEIQEDVTFGFKVIKAPPVSPPLNSSPFPSLNAAVRHCQGHMDNICRRLGFNV